MVLHELNFPFVFFSVFLQLVSEYRTWRDILKSHCILSLPLARTSIMILSLSRNIIQICLRHGFFCPCYYQKASPEPQASEAWKSNLHIKFIHGFLLSICSCATAVTSLRFVLLTGMLSLSSIYRHHVPRSYFIWLTKPCSFNILYMDIRLPSSSLCDCPSLTLSFKRKDFKFTQLSR